MADKTTGALSAVTEAAIGALPGIADLYDDTLLPVEQQGKARHMTGAQWKQYAQAGTKVYVEGAKAAAAAASESAEGAAASADDAAESARAAKAFSGKPPVIQDGTWWTWDAAEGAYVDTGESAHGDLLYATFYVDAGTGTLYMVADDDYAGPRFRLNGANLEVVLSNGN